MLKKKREKINSELSSSEHLNTPQKWDLKEYPDDDKKIEALVIYSDFKKNTLFIKFNANNFFQQKYKTEKGLRNVVDALKSDEPSEETKKMFAKLNRLKFSLECDSENNAFITTPSTP